MPSPMSAQSSNGSPSPSDPLSAPPQQIANVPAPTPLIDMNTFIFQSLMEMQKSVSEIGAKTDRLITDVGKQNEKIDVIRGQINFVRGAAWIIGGLLTALLAVSVAIYNKTPSTTVSSTATPSATTPSSVVPRNSR